MEKKMKPDAPKNGAFRYDAFENGQVVLGKKKGHLPAMGWNSWNAFGSGNTQELTKAMADKIIELGLDRLGYRYLVLDDGCYRPVRVDGKVANETEKFPDGFRALSDYIHEKGLKFGMYNDIGTNLCAGANVGTCGYETVDAACYVEWGVDFLKIDNCYYLWDNATFSDAANVRYVFAPAIREIRIENRQGDEICSQNAGKDGNLTGEGVFWKDGAVVGIGTFDGTGPDRTPIGPQSGELMFEIEAPEDGEYVLAVTYATGAGDGIGAWLTVAVGNGEETEIFYDDFLPDTDGTEDFRESDGIVIRLKKGENHLRLMNHRRQENTLGSYSALLEGLNLADPDHDIIFSICEWGKTQPQNWGYKVGDSWRILNDITFRVGSDGDPGYGAWSDGYTPSVTSQYNKAVIMDRFAGLDKGWNDPDMLMIGMNGLTLEMQKTHMSMWCMMNAPLMLGLDLRRVKKGDELYRILANEEMIALNQDALGIQARRIWSSLAKSRPDLEYIRDNGRLDILAKPLADGSVALSFINVCQDFSTEQFLNGGIEVDIRTILDYIGDEMVDAEAFARAKAYRVTNLWTGKSRVETTGRFTCPGLAPCESVTLKINREL